MATKTDRLRIKLETDGDGRTRSSLAGVEQGLGGIDDQAQRATRSSFNLRRALVSAAGVFSAGLVVRSIKNTLDYADSIDKASQAAGVGAEFLQEFRFAAEQSGVSITGADDSLRRFNRRLGEFANSGGGPAADALESLNISIRDADGNLRSTEDVFTDVVAGLEGVETAAQRSALAAQLFGDDFGPKLVTLLDQGTAGIERLRDTARETGAILSEEVVRDAVAAKDAMNELGTAADGVKNQFILQLAPALTDIARAMNQAARDAGLLQAAWVGLGGLGAAIFTDEFAGVNTLRDDLAGVNEELQRQQAILDALRDSGAPAASTGGVQARVDELRAEAQRLESRIESLTREPPADPEPAIGDGSAGGGSTGGGTGGGDSTGTRKTFSELFGALEIQNRSVRANLEGWAELEEQITAVETVSQRLGRQLTDSEAQAVRDAVAERQRLSAALNENEEAYRSAQEQQREMQRLLRSTIDAVDPTAELTRELERLDALMRSDIGEGFGDAILERMLQINIEMDQLGEKTEEKAQEMSEFAKQAARNMQDSLADFLFDPFDDGLEGMVAGLSNAMRRMAAETAAAKIFESFGGEEGVGGFFSDLFSGGFKIPGFANGTNFAPGGLALVGERGPELVNLPPGSRVTPNERLPGGTTNVINVTVSGGDAERNRQSGGQLARDIARNLERGARRNG